VNFPALIFAGLLLVGLSLQAEIVLNEIDPSLLVEGENMIKAEVHNFTLEDEDLIFDLAVHAQRPIPPNGRKDYTVSYTRDLRTDDTTLTLQVSGDLIHRTNAASDQSGMVFKSAIAPAGTPVANVIFRSYAPIRGDQRYFRLISTL